MDPGLKRNEGLGIWDKKPFSCSLSPLYDTLQAINSVQVQCISPSLQSPTGCVPACVWAEYLMNLRDFLIHRPDTDTNTSQVGRIASSIATALTVDGSI